MDLFTPVTEEEIERAPKVKPSPAITLETVAAAGGSVIVRGMPAHIYHSIPAISSTLLKGYADLPATCRTPYVPKDDAAVGTAVHAFTLQGESALHEECAFMGPECLGKSKGAIAAREQFARDFPGKTYLPAEYGGLEINEVIRKSHEALHAHPTVGEILRDSEKELSLFWIDPETGVLCKARLDIWSPKTRQVWDLKKTAKFDRFEWEVRNLGYKIQGGWYKRGAHACGLDPLTFGLIPFEAEEPWRVDIGYLKDRPNDMNDLGTLEDAQLEAQRLLGLVVESQLTGVWPNFRVPEHIYSLKDLTGDDLIKVW